MKALPLFTLAVGLATTASLSPVQAGAIRAMALRSCAEALGRPARQQCSRVGSLSSDEITGELNFWKGVAGSSDLQPADLTSTVSLNNGDMDWLREEVPVAVETAFSPIPDTSSVIIDEAVRVRGISLTNPVKRVVRTEWIEVQPAGIPRWKPKISLDRRSFEDE